MYRLWPYPHTLDKAGKAFQGQTLFLQRPSNKTMILEALNNEGGYPPSYPPNVTQGLHISDQNNKLKHNTFFSSKLKNGLSKLACLFLTSLSSIGQCNPLVVWTRSSYEERRVL